MGPSRGLTSKSLNNVAIIRNTCIIHTVNPVLDRISAAVINCNCLLDQYHFVYCFRCCHFFADCLKDEFRCTNFRCVSQSKACDGTDDCHDGSDEFDPCGKQNIAKKTATKYL